MLGFSKWILIVIVSIIIIIGTTIFKVAENPINTMLNIYGTIIRFLGDDILTNDKKLKGKREYGIDHYVGTYSANYDNYTGDEILFGGTALSRENGEHINVQIKLKKENGNIKIINRMGENDITILEETGEYNDIIYIEGISYYLVVELDNFKGDLQVKIE